MNNADTQTGYTNEVYKVIKVGSHFRMVNSNGEQVNVGVNTGTRKKAFQQGKSLRAFVGKGGKKQYRLSDMSHFDNLVKPLHMNAEVNIEVPSEHLAVKQFIHDQSIQLRPVSLVMSDLKWKYLIRSAVRAKNIMMVGPSGCGKTQAAYALSKALNRIEHKVEHVTPEQYELMLKDARYEILKVG